MRLDQETLERRADEGARLLALTLLDETDDAAARLGDASDEEALHDFRVALRRLRTILRAFRPTLGRSVGRRLERRLRKLARATNAARDVEVGLAMLQELEPGVPAEDRDAVASVRELLAGDGSPGRGDLARSRRRFGRLSRKLRSRLRSYRRRIDDPPPGSFAGLLAGELSGQLAAWLERVCAIGAGVDEAVIHRARIQGKRLRYLLEPLRGYEDAKSDEAVSRLKALQDALGELHDAHVLSVRLAELSAEAPVAALAHAEAAESPAGAAPAGEPRGDGVRRGAPVLERLLRDRRSERFRQLEDDWRAGGIEALAAEVKLIASALRTRVDGVEIERKYLLSRLPPHVEDHPATEIAQGWLPGRILRERVRRIRGAGGERYYRAMKLGTGLRRFEAEEETTREVFEALWPLTEGRRIAKLRRKVPDGALTWEIDAFSGRELVLAEVELPDGDEPPLPDWLRPFVVREVTDEPAYLNENLAAAGAPEQGAQR